MGNGVYMYLCADIYTVFYGKETPCAHNPRVVQRNLGGDFWKILGGILEVLNTVSEDFREVVRIFFRDLFRSNFVLYVDPPGHTTDPSKL